MMRSILDRVLQKKHYCGVLQKHITVEFCKKKHDNETIGDKKTQHNTVSIGKKIAAQNTWTGDFFVHGVRKKYGMGLTRENQGHVEYRGGAQVCMTKNCLYKNCSYIFWIPP